MERNGRFGMRWMRVCLLGILSGLSCGVAATTDSGARILALGVLLHDRGLLSDYHEKGVDPNLEIQFRPLSGAIGQAIGAPRPHLGITPNLVGDTSALYGGVTYEIPLKGRWFVAPAIGLALHDGPLHKSDVARCQLDSDCGFGSRVLFRGALEIGYRWPGGEALSFYFDHMSQYRLLDSENEGVDHAGIRYLRRF